MTTPETFIGEARISAAQCWCDETTASIPMDTRLAEVFAWRLAAWMNTAAQNQRNVDYWRERTAIAETQNSQLREVLHEFATQHHCGCGHPVCNACGRDRMAQDALAEIK